MTDELLIATIAERFQFRQRRRHETLAAYRVALIDHVEPRDFTAAHEIRTGRPHADWTPADVAQFRERILQVPATRGDFPPGQTPEALQVLASPPPPGVTVDTAWLRELAEAGLQSLIRRRINEPEWQVPILISALLLDGTLLTTTSHRSDRIAILRYMTRNAPVFGFFIAADMFLHTMSDTKASRAEGILMHIGTRELRIARVAEYTRTASGIVFKNPYDIDLRRPAVQDPYADIFVSTPQPGGKTTH